MTHGDQVETYTVQVGSLRARTDLCTEHAEPLRRILIDKGVNGSTTRPPLDMAHFDSLVVKDIKEVEKLKKDYLKTHPSSVEAGLLPQR